VARFFCDTSRGQYDSKRGLIGGAIEAGPNPDRPGFLHRPPLFGGGEVPLKQGGVTLSIVGVGWWHIGAGEYVDLPEGIPVATVKDLCPQLLTLAEAVTAGLAYEDGRARERERPAQHIELLAEPGHAKEDATGAPDITHAPAKRKHDK